MVACSPSQCHFARNKFLNCLFSKLLLTSSFPCDKAHDYNKISILPSNIRMTKLPSKFILWHFNNYIKNIAIMKNDNDLQNLGIKH